VGPAPSAVWDDPGKSQGLLAREIVISAEKHGFSHQESLGATMEVDFPIKNGDFP